VKGLYETGSPVFWDGVYASDLGPEAKSVRPAASSPSDMVPSASANGSGSDAYAYPDTRRSDANPVSDAVADSNFGTDYARRGVYRDRGSTPRNPCLGRQWAFDLGGYRQTRRGPGKSARTFVSTLFRQEV